MSKELPQAFKNIPILFWRHGILRIPRFFFVLQNCLVNSSKLTGAFVVNYAQN